MGEVGGASTGNNNTNGKNRDISNIKINRNDDNNNKNEDKKEAGTSNDQDVSGTRGTDTCNSKDVYNADKVYANNGQNASSANVTGASTDVC